MKSSESRKFNPSPHTHLFTVQIRVVSPWLCSPSIRAFTIHNFNKTQMLIEGLAGCLPETWIDLVVVPHYMLEGGQGPEFRSDVCRIDRYAHTYIHTYIQVCSTTPWTTGVSYLCFDDPWGGRDGISGSSCEEGTLFTISCALPTKFLWTA